jgi:site-specific DNA-methyltransferase (adenine-specific)
MKKYTSPDGRIVLINGDCADYMSRLDNKSFDLAVVDPPYGIGVNVNIGRRKGQKNSGYHKYAGEDASPPDEEYFLSLHGVSRNQVIWGANHFIDLMPSPANSPCWLMWDKGFSDEVTFAQFEMAWTSFKTTCKKYDKSPNDPSRIHPTQKPVKLYDWIFANYAKSGDRILDTHLGIGSSAIAAHYAGLEFVGIELDPDYYAAAVDRFKRETAQEALF